MLNKTIALANHKSGAHITTRFATVSANKNDVKISSINCSVFIEYYDEFDSQLFCTLAKASFLLIKTSHIQSIKINSTC